MRPRCVRVQNQYSAALHLHAYLSAASDGKSWNAIKHHLETNVLRHSLSDPQIRTIIKTMRREILPLHGEYMPKPIRSDGFVYRVVSKKNPDTDEVHGLSIEEQLDFAGTLLSNVHTNIVTAMAQGSNSSLIGYREQVKQAIFALS